jgi:hypothetical protein
MLALAHAFLSGTSRLQFSIIQRGLGRRLACRRLALEKTVEKVVTGSVAASVAVAVSSAD